MFRHSSGDIYVSASDLSSFVFCRRKAQLSYLEKINRESFEKWGDPYATLLQDRGYAHEAAYLERLKQSGLSVTHIDDGRAASRRPDYQFASTGTEQAMARGDEVIAQGHLAQRFVLPGADSASAETFVVFHGFADILRRTERQHSRFGPYAYEVWDTKLAQDSKATSVLQLCLYSDALAELQGVAPQQLYIVTPKDGFTEERYWLQSYAAYYRKIRQEFLLWLAAIHAADPNALNITGAVEPVDHCEVCSYAKHCDAQRRSVDHLSFVAGLSNRARLDLYDEQVPTLAALADVPTPLKWRPTRATTHVVEQGKYQAALQKQARQSDYIPFTLKLPGPGDTHPFLSLPMPSPGDLFLDFEGSPFIGTEGREYLFGLASLHDVALTAPDYPLYPRVLYEHRWGVTHADEREAFVWLIERINKARAQYPDAHVYHYAAYEPSAIKRLAQKHGILTDKVDALLRDEVLIDLCQVVKQSMRAGVESYGLKSMEALYGAKTSDGGRTAPGFVRRVPLEQVGLPKRAVEQLMESGREAELAATLLGERRADSHGDLSALCNTVLGYNQDDCVSTFALREWLWSLRQSCIDAGHDVPLRPAPEAVDDEVESKNPERDQLVKRLLSLAEQTTSEHADGHVLSATAHLLTFYEREDKPYWWERFRLLELTHDETLDEGKVIGGLRHLKTEKRTIQKLGKTGKPLKPKDEFWLQFSFEAQSFDLEVGDKVIAPRQTAWADPSEAGYELTQSGEIQLPGDFETSPGTADAVEPPAPRLFPNIGTLADIDFEAQTIWIQSAKEHLGRDELAALRFIALDEQLMPSAVLTESLCRLGQDLADHYERHREFGNFDSKALSYAALQLLRRVPASGWQKQRVDSPAQTRVSVSDAVLAMSRGVLGVQGPPGSGKTTQAAEAIATLLKLGHRVGVCGPSHKVIEKLMTESLTRSEAQGQTVIAFKQSSTSDRLERDRLERGDESSLWQSGESKKAHLALEQGATLLGGTSWLFSRPEMCGALDYLFVDEAGQLHLANVLATAHAAPRVVLLGDPQQLDQPTKALHPEGIAVSALGHLLGEHKTLPQNMGVFLPETHRLPPQVCQFTAEVFYESRLAPGISALRRALEARPRSHIEAPISQGLYVKPVDHSGCSSRSLEEAHAVAQLVQDLLNQNIWFSHGEGSERPITPSDILIVAPYNLQVRAIRSALGELDLSDVEVGTVDKFQGQEAPIVIYSMTSSSPADAPRGMSFLYSLNRFNVATSRSMGACILVANPALFEVVCQTPKQVELVNAFCRYLELAKVL